MTTFSALQIGRTGVGFAHHWIDTVAHNLANSNTATATNEEPFRALHSVARPLGGGPYAATGSGVYTAAQLRDGREPIVVHDPSHPLADEDGMVQMPVMDTGGQMVDLMMAQRHYQANLKTIEAAREAYQSALRLGAQ